MFGILASVLLVLARRAAIHAGNALPHASPERALLVVLGAVGCGAWGETMRQLVDSARRRRDGGSGSSV